MTSRRQGKRRADRVRMRRRRRAALPPCPSSFSFQPSERARRPAPPSRSTSARLAGREDHRSNGAASRCGSSSRTPEQLAKSPSSTPAGRSEVAVRNPGELTPEYAATRRARSSRKCWWWWASARTSAARRPTSSRPGRSPRCRTTGRAAFSARATAPPSTWPAACSRTSQRRTTSEVPPHVPVRHPLLIGEDKKA